MFATKFCVFIYQLLLLLGNSAESNMQPYTVTVMLTSGSHIPLFFPLSIHCLISLTSKFVFLFFFFSILICILYSSTYNVFILPFSWALRQTMTSYYYILVLNKTKIQIVFKMLNHCLTHIWLFSTLHSEQFRINEQIKSSTNQTYYQYQNQKS